VLRQEDDEILLRVILGFIAWARDNDIQYCYFLINAALARVLKRLSVPLAIAGPEVEHRGTRRPYKTHIATALQDMRANLPRVSRILEHSEPYVRYSEFAEQDLRPSAGHPIYTPQPWLQPIQQKRIA
jgi:N-acyl amino acid synthase of PEP-CTERM/exosortase system